MLKIVILYYLECPNFFDTYFDYFTNAAYWIEKIRFKSFTIKYDNLIQIFLSW